jgi:hypothetical protein
MCVLERRTTAGPRLGAIPDRLFPEGDVPDPALSFVQRLWGAVRASRAWPVLAICILPFWIYKLRDLPLNSAIGGILALVIPGLLYGMFLVVQKHQNGWYLYPFHENQVNFHWSAMKGTLVDCVSTVFVQQGRLALSVIVALWIFFRLLGRRESERRFVPSLAWSFAVFAIGVLVFSAGNVFMKRYLLCLLPPLWPHYSARCLHHGIRRRGTA